MPTWVAWAAYHQKDKVLLLDVEKVFGARTGRYHGEENQGVLESGKGNIFDISNKFLPNSNLSAIIIS